MGLLRPIPVASDRAFDRSNNGQLGVCRVNPLAGPLNLPREVIETHLSQFQKGILHWNIESVAWFEGSGKAGQRLERFFHQGQELEKEDPLSRNVFNHAISWFQSLRGRDRQIPTEVTRYSSQTSSPPELLQLLKSPERSGNQSWQEMYFVPVENKGPDSFLLLFSTVPVAPTCERNIQQTLEFLSDFPTAPSGIRRNAVFDQLTSRERQCLTWGRIVIRAKSYNMDFERCTTYRYSTVFK